jgi:hypothetical protein
MAKLPEERKLHDLIALVEEKLNTSVYLSSIPLKLHSRVGNEYFGYYCFYEEKAFRLEYLNQDLVGCSFWDNPASLLDSTMRVDFSDIDETQSQSLLIKFLVSMPDAEDDSDNIEEVNKFIDHIGMFIKNKGASYAYDSYEPWAETNEDSKQLGKTEFYDAFNKVVNQTDSGMSSRIESPIVDEQVIISENQSLSFTKDVLNNEDYLSDTLLESTIKCMAEEEILINAVFVCGSKINEAKEIIKSVLQEEGVWYKKVLWKDRTTSIYQFISLLWKYRSGYILVFDNVDLPVKNKDHNFNMLLDEVMKTESTNRIVSYSRRDKDNE